MAVNTIEQEVAVGAETIAGQLRQRIMSSLVDGYQRLPSERVLARQYRVPLRIVREAMAQLAREGLVRRIPRGGTFVQTEGTPYLRTPRSSRLHCVTLVERVWPFAESLAFVMWRHLAGYTEALDDTGVKMRFVPFSQGAQDYSALLSPHFPADRQGAILVSLHDAGLMRWLGSQRIPFVVQGVYAYETTGLPDHHSVVINRDGAAFQAVQHMLGLGHRRIGFVGNTTPEGGKQVIMHRGYTAALVSAGIPWRAEDILNFSTDVPERMREPALQYLQRPSLPTAVVCQNDITAMGLLQVARELGIRVPQDLSVTGFDNRPDAAETDPPLTTFSNPTQEAARDAALMLLDASDGKFAAFQRRVLDCTMVQRNSVGRAPAEHA